MYEEVTMNNNGFVAKRIIRSYQQKIQASSSVVFPLLCPVREAEWLDGWDYRLVYSESGFAEEGCVFTSRQEGEEDTIWLITKRDEESRVTEFVRITPGSRVAKLDIAVEDTSKEMCLVNITYTYTALNEKGNKFLEKLTEEKFITLMRFWEDSMNHFLKTGEQLAQ